MNISQQSFQIKCSQHTNEDANFLQIDEFDENKQVFLCDICLNKNRNIRHRNFTLIKEVIEASENTILQKWPSLQNELLIEQFIQVLNRKNAQINYITSFFDNLKCQIIQKIEDFQKNILKIDYFDQISQLQKQMHQSLKDLQKLKEFQLILKDQTTKNIQKEKNCYDFISSFVENKLKNTEKLEEIHNKYKNLNAKLNQQDFNKLEQSIFKSIDNLFIKQISKLSNQNEQQPLSKIIIENQNEIKINLNLQNILEQPYLQEIEEFIQFGQEISQPQYLNKQLQIIDDEDLEEKNKRNVILKLEQRQQQNFLDILPQLNLQLSKFIEGNQKKMKIYNKQSQHIYIENQSSIYRTYFSSFILQRNKNYIFRFKFERINNQNEGFFIGLIKDESKDSSYSYCQDLSFWFRYLYPNFNGHAIYQEEDIEVKGSLKNTDNIDCIELRINIDNCILEALDYPNYLNIISIDQKRKDILKDNQNFRFAIHLHNEINVEITYAAIQQQFDN